MSRTVVSSKFQVVIPKDVRNESGLKKGQRFQVLSRGGVITLVPEEPLSALKGFAKRVRASGFREKKERL